MKTTMLALAVLALCAAAPNPKSNPYMTAVASAMREPGAVVFRGVHTAPAENGTVVMVSGQMNTKNAYGGYTGFITFCARVSPYRVRVWTERDESLGFVQIMCGG